ncbi:MAG: aldehyde dehydrogenase family protein [Bdellovibrionales bacterium]|nr:aldehyde dehydrogenase family protein [Bdellovibrionales bacterium]
MKNLNLINPFTGEKLASFPVQPLEDVQKDVHRLHQTQRKWAKLSLKERVHAVENAITYFETHRDQIARDISEEMGRPLHQCQGEVNGFFERARYMISIAETTLASDIIEDSDEFFREIQHVPLGVVFVISAWNYPLLITVNSVIPALIAGNTILLKHSSRTPLIGQHFEQAFSQMLSLGPFVKNIVVDHATTGEIIEKLAIDHVVFTGSVKGGHEILRHTSKKFLQPQLELGGKDAAYVHRDADIRRAAESVVDGTCYNSGQSCCGIERVYVHKDVYEEFKSYCLELMKSYRLGDPSSPETQLGPMAQKSAVDEALNQVQEALAQGAKVLCGGDGYTIKEGHFLKPTLLENVHSQMSVMQEENFSPVLPLQKVENESQALDFINDSDYGLTTAIFTSDRNFAKNFAADIESGTVFMNRCDYLDPALPWTGVKNSGVGSSLSKYGYYGLTRRKSIHFRK